MNASSKRPSYVDAVVVANEAYFEVSQLVRSADDARRLLVPIRTMAEFVGLVEVAESFGQLLLRWDDHGFAASVDQALALLDELHGVFEERVGEIDPVCLGEIRVPLYALSIALSRRQEGLDSVYPTGQMNSMPDSRDGSTFHISDRPGISGYEHTTGELDPFPGPSHMLT
ncbi:MAG: hypothetical protein KF873_23590 [Gemmataceae bacterium]|nr:hypothetical protein [Gemmataceae bacterium]